MRTPAVWERATGMFVCGHRTTNWSSIGRLLRRKCIKKGSRSAHSTPLCIKAPFVLSVLHKERGLGHMTHPSRKKPLREFAVQYEAVLIDSDKREIGTVSGEHHVKAFSFNHAKSLTRQYTYGAYGAGRCATPSAVELPSQARD